MRIFIWHGYLLSGTGSNEYTRALTQTLAREGHEVTVFCQDPHAQELDLNGAKVVRPELPGPLPVFVLDHYEDSQAALLQDLAPDVLDAYIEANVAAIRAQGEADLLFCNHLLMGGPVGAASGLPFVVKAHGSELEYSMRGDEALCRWAGEVLPLSQGVLAGSDHIRSVIDDLLPLPDGLIHVIPPGVDTELMRPRDRELATETLIAECEADPPNHGNERLPDPGNAARFEEFLARPGPVITYVGKLSEQKGVSLLLDAAVGLDANLLIIGFGPARAELEAQAQRLGLSNLFSGPLQHRHLAQVWPLASVSVVPSIFPEAFGMVAAEAASCGCPPVVAYHSGLAEIADGLVAHLPAPEQGLVSFPTGETAALADRMQRILALEPSGRDALSAGCREAVVQLWSWSSVARRILDLVPH